MEDKIKEIIEKNPVALASVSNSIKPHVIVVAFAKVKDNKIIITDNYMNKTIENLKNSPFVSLVVWNNKLEGYKIQGEAEYFNNGKWLSFVKSIPENKNEFCKGALIIKINEIKKA